MIYEYESTTVPYVIQHTYTPDFPPSGILLEHKGYWDPEDRRKNQGGEGQNPELDIRMVFQTPYNKISKKSKTTYLKWCDKHDIPWCEFHSIPIEWLT